MEGINIRPQAIIYHINLDVTSDELNTLFTTARPVYVPSDLKPVLSRSLAYVCAREGDQLVGFVNLAWDGGVHAFVLDTTVHPDFQRRGIGRQLVKCAAETAKAHHVEWLHVDYQPHLHHFYQQCGFVPTQAGLINLRQMK